MRRVRVERVPRVAGGGNRRHLVDREAARPVLHAKVTALDERTGTMRWPATVPSMPMAYESVRRISGLYDAYTCVSSPSL